MAQSTLHFGIGMLCATALTLRPVWRAWRNKLPLATPIARWCLWSYGIGAVAVIPAMARRLTDVDPTHPLWNLCIAYPLLDKLPLPSIALGELLMATILAVQYGSILLAIYRISRGPSTPPDS